ncbi:MAG: DUF4831 family protein, partial [Bacteroidales bacterium]|nr:DUF4831 family protein [Bacteroidales bacterium]
MQNPLKFTCLALITILAASCAANRTMSSSRNSVAPMSGRPAITEGSLVYGLPLSVVDVEIEAEHVIEKPGPYSRYANDFLGLRDVITSENEYWTITGLTISTHEELDPDHFYVISAVSEFRTNVLSMKKQGLILDLNPEIYNSAGRYSVEDDSYLDRLDVYDLGSDEYFLQRKDTLYRVVNLDTTFVRVPYLVEKKQKLTIDQLAEKAAIRLMELRDGKHMILTGETNLFPQDEAAIIEMNRIEKEYTELFTGKTLSVKQKFRYQVIPAKEKSTGKITLCRFSEMTGFSDPSSGSGTPVEIEFA